MKILGVVICTLAFGLIVLETEVGDWGRWLKIAAFVILAVLGSAYVVYMILDE